MYIFSSRKFDVCTAGQMVIISVVMWAIAVFVLLLFISAVNQRGLCLCLTLWLVLINADGHEGD